jgi:hypothetical protein
LHAEQLPLPSQRSSAFDIYTPAGSAGAAAAVAAASSIFQTHRGIHTSATQAAAPGAADNSVTSKASDATSTAAAAVETAATAAAAAVAAASSSSTAATTAPGQSITAAAAASYADLAASVLKATEETLGPLSVADLVFGLQAVAKKHRQAGLTYSIEVRLSGGGGA